MYDLTNYEKECILTLIGEEFDRHGHKPKWRDYLDDMNKLALKLDPNWKTPVTEADAKADHVS